MSKRVLVVEDDALLGLDIAEQLADAGFRVIGPATSVAKAFSLMQEFGCDAAVLDVNLGNETAEPIAIELRARGTPFIVLSGYSSEQHPPGFRGASTLAKPARPGDLVALLSKSMGEVERSPIPRLVQQPGTVPLGFGAEAPAATVAIIQGNCGSGSKDDE
jgi:DNA-binding response OmpR family regulator